MRRSIRAAVLAVSLLLTDGAPAGAQQPAGGVSTQTS